jgi:hypothetical protein
MEKIIASTSYDDLQGAAALDFHNGLSDLYNFAEEKGIDTKRYHIKGLDVAYIERTFSLAFLVVDSNNLKNALGYTPIIKIYVEEDEADFYARYKRLNIVVISGGNFSNYILDRTVHLNEL